MYVVRIIYSGNSSPSPGLASLNGQDTPATYREDVLRSRCCLYILCISKWLSSVTGRVPWAEPPLAAASNTAYSIRAERCIHITILLYKACSFNYCYMDLIDSSYILGERSLCGIHHLPSHPHLWVLSNEYSSFNIRTYYPFVRTPAAFECTRFRDCATSRYFLDRCVV